MFTFESIVVLLLVV